MFAPSMLSDRLIQVDKILSETFECEECGQCFDTQTALRRHCFKFHLVEDQKLERQREVKNQAHQSQMEHAKDGMPWCTHCLRKFINWPDFHYHVNCRSTTVGGAC